MGDVILTIFPNIKEIKMINFELTHQDKLDALEEYKENLECLSQFACSENLNLIEALTDNLLAHLVEMKANL